MISIITAIYNQLDMNKLFWKYLQKYTDNTFELIIIDNRSDDGSREFFQSLGENVTVIANQENYSYPYCQNQGIAVAKYDTLAFLNNDLLVSPHWDSRSLEILGKDNRDVISLGSNDRLFNRETSKSLQKRWKLIKYPSIALFGQRTFSLKLMQKLCYGNWGKFTDKIYKRYGLSITEGFSGASIIMNRKAIEKVGLWDQTQQFADFDLFFRTCQRAETVGDIKPMTVVNGIFTHHYRRLTLYSNCPPFSDADQLIPLDKKWNADDFNRWMKIVNFQGNTEATTKH